MMKDEKDKKINEEQLSDVSGGKNTDNGRSRGGALTPEQEQILAMRAGHRSSFGRHSHKPN